MHDLPHRVEAPQRRAEVLTAEAIEHAVEAAAAGQRRQLRRVVALPPTHEHLRLRETLLQPRGL